MTTLRTATLTALLFVAASAFPARAEDKPKSVITILPLARSFSPWMFGLEWEAPVSGISYYMSPAIENPLNGQPLHLTLDIGIRFYPFAPVPRAFWIGPYVGGGYVNGPPGGQPLGVQAEMHAGVMLGYSQLLGDIFLLSAGVGGEYYRNQYIQTNGLTSLEHEDLRTVFRLAVGFAF